MIPTLTFLTALLRCWPRHPPFELFLRQRLDLQRIEGICLAA